MSDDLAMTIEAWKTEFLQAGKTDDFSSMVRNIDGLTIPPLAMEGMDTKPSPRLIPDKPLTLVQTHHAQDLAAIQEDIANGVGGIRLLGDADAISQALHAIGNPDILIALANPDILPDKNPFFIDLEQKTTSSLQDELADGLSRALEAPPHHRLGLTLNSHLFISIAKLRAARWLWAALNHDALEHDRTLRIHAIAPPSSLKTPLKTPLKKMTPEKDEEKDEVWHHLLVNLIACFAAICGSADSLTLLPHDQNHPDAKRLARNIFLIAKHEGLLGRSLDPTAGAWLVEQLTRQIAEQAWSKIEPRFKPSAKLPQVPEQHPQTHISSSDEKIKIKSLYTQKDLPQHIHSLPGQPPFTRGPYAAMYLTRPWTIRQYAGFSTAEDSNNFYRNALAHGQKGLSVAFDLPTHRGYDSDQQEVAHDVGMAGVAIDCLEDMQILFDQIPLDQVSVSMTMNGAVLPIMALYIATAETQNVKPQQLSGTIQNDILKEFMVRNTYIYPPEPSMRIVADIFAYTAKHMPKFNTISVSGYHMQEAGATKDLELAYTLADGMEYVRAGLKAGLAIDDFAPRISFFWCIGMDFFMEVAKMRAARLLWAEIMQNFGAKNTKSMALRTHCQTSGWSLTARDPFNNIVRTSLEAMAAISGGTQSLHTNALDEAMALPNQFSAKLARDTQLFLQKDSDLCASIDGWGGSYYVERLTADIADRARVLIDEVESLGGMTQAIAQGLPKKRIQEAATRTQANIDSNQRIIVGVNKFLAPNEPDVHILKVDNMAVRENQIQRLRKARARRDQAKVKQKLEAIALIASRAASSKDNLLAACVEAARLGASVGEMSSVMEQAFTRYQTRPKMIKGVYEEASAGNERLSKARALALAFKQQRGFAPHILIAKAGQDGHDRGQHVVAAAYADMGFDVVLGRLFRSAEEIAKQAIQENVHIVAISSLAGAHLPLARALIKNLDAADRGDILVVVGGIIPHADIASLKEAGVKAVYPPGTDVSASAVDLLELIRGRN